MNQITTLQILRVMDEFDAFGGSSIELAAWELDVGVPAMLDAWEQLAAAELIEVADLDLDTGELTFRLTDAGREVRAGRRRRLFVSAELSCARG
jgi:hypothetical protein